jgi:hypothetical protein
MNSGESPHSPQLSQRPITSATVEPVTSLFDKGWMAGAQRLQDLPTSRFHRRFIIVCLRWKFVM